jgi:Skp family chaperone for outer membrane proteins
MKKGTISNLQLGELSRDEGEMRRLTLAVVSGLLLPIAAFAQQAPAAGGPGAGRVAVVDFQKAVTENSEGKKAQEKFMAELNRRQKDFEDKQKTMTDAQTKLQTGDKALSETAKADLAKLIDKINTELQRMNDDAQKDLGDLQQQLFRPIAEKTQDVLKSYSNENGFAVVFDISQGNSILYWQDVADITTEIIRRVDASPAKPAATTPAAAPKPPAPDPAKK